MAAAERMTSGLEDEELIERIYSAGDQVAFEALYQRYFPRVFRFVDKRLRNRADTEETVQEVFFAVFSSIGSYRGDAPFAAWVLGLSRRVVANRFKKKRHTTVPLEMDDENEKVDSDHPTARRQDTPLEVYEYQERLAQLEDAAAHRLSRHQWRLFELHHLQHRPIQEIAHTLQKSEDAIKSNLYRARKLLLAR